MCTSHKGGKIEENEMSGKYSTYERERSEAYSVFWCGNLQ